MEGAPQADPGVPRATCRVARCVCVCVRVCVSARGGAGEGVLPQDSQSWIGAGGGQGGWVGIFFTLEFYRRPFKEHPKLGENRPQLPLAFRLCFHKIILPSTCTPGWPVDFAPGHSEAIPLNKRNKQQAGRAFVQNLRRRSPPILLKKGSTSAWLLLFLLFGGRGGEGVPVCVCVCVCLFFLWGVRDFRVVPLCVCLCDWSLSCPFHPCPRGLA